MDRIDWPLVWTGAVSLCAVILMLVLAWKLTKLLIKILFTIAAIGILAAFVVACLTPRP
jgi:hypothetical protein